MLYLLTMFNVVLLGCAFLGGIGVMRVWPSRWVAGSARMLFPILLLIPLNAVRCVLSGSVSVLALPAWIGIFGAGGVRLVAGWVGIASLVLVLWRGQRALAKWARAALLVMAPVVPLVFVQASWSALRNHELGFEQRVVAQPLPSGQSQGRRVVWIVFDEWDQRLTFEGRPRGLELPEFDRLRGEAVYATQAYPPADTTLLSIASMITGRWATAAKTAGSDDLTLKFWGVTQEQRWSAQRSLFGALRGLGFNAGIAGWYLPYCRILNRDVTACAWAEMSMHYNSLGSEADEALVNEWRALVDTNSSFLFASLGGEKHQMAGQYILKEARRMVVNPSLDLVLVHVPVTHEPYLYSRAEHGNTLRRSPVTGYLDALVLADKTLAALRVCMERSLLWDGTTVLVSSDHWFRKALLLDGKLDKRVPFLIKLAYQRASRQYGRPFNTVLTHDLLLALFAGQIVNVESLTTWLNDNASRFPVTPVIGRR